MQPKTKTHCFIKMRNGSKKLKHLTRHQISHRVKAHGFRTSRWGFRHLTYRRSTGYGKQAHLGFVCCGSNHSRRTTICRRLCLWNVGWRRNIFWKIGREASESQSKQCLNQLGFKNLRFVEPLCNVYKGNRKSGLKEKNESRSEYPQGICFRADS